ncbi:type I phosphodiesterase/nucleotide pyrophosphatase [Actinobacteria bacterium OK074]|nr:type I phosphodiesterase/nucleotide pyrophosphatase [Actinobacteria bacterium OK074]
MTTPHTPRTNRLVVLDITGLTPALLKHMPALSALGERGFRARLGATLPPATPTAQATFLTGELPSGHGIVGNGWYFRELGEVRFWQQHHGLIDGERIWQTARRQVPSYKVANICWWYALGSDVDLTVAPRPVYYADGRRETGCYTYPPYLYDELASRLGPFPLHNMWGPEAGMPLTQWNLAAARKIFDEHSPDLTLVVAPQLAYEPQKSGPDSRQTIRVARRLDAVLRPYLDHWLRAGATVVALSPFGITPVSRPVDINRVLRRAGLLEVYRQDAMEYLDPWTSRAFAVADHQLAHVYVRDPADIPRTAKILAELDGVSQVLGEAEKKAYGLDHERSGELVAVACPDSWFTYYYWMCDARAPDFARQIDLQHKPGYDPAELLYDSSVPWMRARVLGQLARKKLGFRYRMETVPLAPTGIRGSYGRLPDDPAHGPVLVCSNAAQARPEYAATEVKSLLLRLAGLEPDDPEGPDGPYASDGFGGHRR